LVPPASKVQVRAPRRAVEPQLAQRLQVALPRRLLMEAQRSLLGARTQPPTPGLWQLQALTVAAKQSQVRQEE
jgi:hypothetical protein